MRCRLALMACAAFDPLRTGAGWKSRSAAVCGRAVMCYRLGRAQEGPPRPIPIQNDSGLGQGLATCSAAG
jgi:hypothetical protein